jgi:hypothetical protein
VHVKTFIPLSKKTKMDEDGNLIPKVKGNTDKAKRGDGQGDPWVHQWQAMDIPTGKAVPGTNYKMLWTETETAGGSVSPDAGYKQGSFVWSLKGAKKTSYGKEVKFPAQLVKRGAADDKMISLQAVRLICVSIFQRCMYPMTSRQAIAFADSAFSRSRIAPCFTDAIVLKSPVDAEGHNVYGLPGVPKGGLSAIYKGPDEEDTVVFKYTDVLSYVNMAWDKALNMNAGKIDLWIFGTNDVPLKPSLTDLIKYSPYGSAACTLLLRGRRAGDGDWFEYHLKFNHDSLQGVSYGGDGLRDINLVTTTPPKDTALVPLDVDNDVQHLKWLSKEEFMSGMVGSPVLAESLRRMTSADTTPKESQIANLRVKVDTGIGDTEFAGFVSVGKKILMEVWDKKKTGGSVPRRGLDQRPRGVPGDVRENLPSPAGNRGVGRRLKQKRHLHELHSAKRQCFFAAAGQGQEKGFYEEVDRRRHELVTGPGQEGQVEGGTSPGRVEHIRSLDLPRATTG